MLLGVGRGVVFIGHLLGLQIYAGSFETGWWRESVLPSHGRHLLGPVQRCLLGLGSSWRPGCHSAQFCLMIYLLLLGKKKRKK
jgi:hypothetical protein